MRRIEFPEEEDVEEIVISVFIDMLLTDRPDWVEGLIEVEISGSIMIASFALAVVVNVFVVSETVLSSGEIVVVTITTFLVLAFEEVSMLRLLTILELEL